MKKLTRVFNFIGDVGMVGIGGTIIYFGTVVVKFALREMNSDLFD